MNIITEYINFFKQKGHIVKETSSLIPNDESLLFTNAGMVPFKPIFTGEIPIPKNKKVTSLQTCLRAGGKHNDLENVGHTARHHTLFEMLGNFSFGDYFKEEAIEYAWEFVTKILNLEIDKLWVTVHDSDDEAEKIWEKYISKDRIVKLGDEDNFWQMGDVGPCGPSSEIFYDQGEENFNSPNDIMGGDGDRFLEIWNLVFMQYNRQKNGELIPLPKPSVDTGLGLERIIAIKEGKLSNYDSSLFMPMIRKVEKLTNIIYVYKEGSSFRVIVDHIRPVTFLLAQGITFNKEGRGYVLRRILRRAIRHGYQLGLREPFMYKLVDTLVEIMQERYTYLNEKKETIKKQIQMEEERFFKTISKGMKLFEEELIITKNIFSGKVAFKLYDTYGFPLDLTKDMLKENDIDININEFNELMNKQKQSGKQSWKKNIKNESNDFKNLLNKFSSNNFIGYSNTETSTKILSILDENFQEINFLEKNKFGWIMLETTPFYAESGGQIGDKGEIEGLAKVIDTKEFFGLNLSKIYTNSKIETNTNIIAKVLNRNEIAKHHTATHLLQSSLISVLGKDISQAGSLVEENRLRFDFTYPRALTHEELIKIEEIVNNDISENIKISINEYPIKEAKKLNAISLFNEKYGDYVRVVSIKDKSIEFCGGTHVNTTSEIGIFFIIKESSVSAGVRRIEAVVSKSAYKYAKKQIINNNEALEKLKSQDLSIGIENLKTKILDLRQQLKEKKDYSQKELQYYQINDSTVIIDFIETNNIKEVIDNTKNKYNNVAILLFTVKNNKVSIASGIKNCKLDAGEWIKEVAKVVGGKGGGRKDFAQAGGNNPQKIKEAMNIALEYAKNKI